MKIGVFFPRFSKEITGGAGGLLLHLCDQLIKMGNEVTLVTGEIGESWKSTVPKNLEVIRSGVTFETNNRNVGLLAQHLDVLRMIKMLAMDYDVLNIHNYPMALAAAAGRIIGNLQVPIVYQCNEPPRFAYDLMGESFRSAGLIGKLALSGLVPAVRLIDGWSVRHVDAIVSISKYMKEEIQRIYGKKCDYVMPGIELDRFNPSVDGGEIRTLLDLENDFVILSSNILHVRKRIDVLIRALPLVLEENRNVKVLITGTGPEELRLKALVSRLGLERTVIFTGCVSAEVLPQYYSACDVFAFTAIREPQIGSPAEALASGKPVLVPNDGSPAETIIEGETGFLYKPLDHVDLARRIIWCVNNPDYLRKMKTSCRRWVEQNMTWARMADDTFRIFERCLKFAGVD